MRIITLNANGIRAAARKGVFTWLATQQADIVCLQETKAQQHQLDDAVFSPAGYQRFFCDAKKPGYSGVAIYTRHQPNNVSNRIGVSWADDEGRFLQLDFNHFSVVSLYLPSGSSGDERQQLKFELMQHYQQTLADIVCRQQSMIICGDWNIVHKEIDIKNFKANQKSSGCLPEERAWLDDVFVKTGWVDAFRVINQQAGEYTWWSNRGRAWDNNVGWRIDYQLITPDLADKVQAVSIYKDQRFSDHAPLIVDYQGLVF